MAEDKIESVSRPRDPINDTVDCIIKSRNTGAYADPSACAAAIMQLESFSKTDRVKALIASLRADPDPTKPHIRSATPPSSPPPQTPERPNTPPVISVRFADEHHV